MKDVAAPGAVVGVPLADGSLGLVFLFASSGSGRELPKVLAAAERSYFDQGFTKSESAKTDARVWTFTPPEPRRTETARVLFVADGFYGAANSPAAADAILSTAAQESLAGDADFQASRVPSASASGASIARFFIRPLALWDAARDHRVARKPAKDRLTAARRLGFDKVRAIGANANLLSTGSCAWELTARVMAAKPFGKGLRVLSFVAGPLPELPAWLDANFSSAWQMRMDFATVMCGYGNLYDESSEPGPDGEGLFDDLLNGLRDDPEGVRVDLRKDVFPSLGPEAIRVNYDGVWLYRIGVADQPRVLAALTRFYKGDKRVQHEQVAGHELWTVGLGASLFVEGQGTATLSIRALAVGHDQMLLSIAPEQLRRL